MLSVFLQNPIVTNNVFAFTSRGALSIPYFRDPAAAPSHRSLAALGPFSLSGSFPDRISTRVAKKSYYCFLFAARVRWLGNNVSFRPRMQLVAHLALNSAS